MSTCGDRRGVIQRLEFCVDRKRPPAEIIDDLLAHIYGSGFALDAEERVAKPSRTQFRLADGNQWMYRPDLAADGLEVLKYRRWIGPASMKNDRRIADLCR